MARDGYPDDPNNYSDSDPTQYANYGGTGGEAYSDYQQPGYDQPGYGQPTGYGQVPEPEPPTPWHRKPVALIGLGVLTAVVLAFLVYAVVKFTSGDSSSPAVTSTTTPTSSVDTSSSASVAPGPGGTTQTVTESPSTSTETPTTTTETPTTTTTTQTPSTSTSTTTSTSTSTSTSTTVSTATVTETVTTTQQVLPTLPSLLPRPGQNGQ